MGLFCSTLFDFFTRKGVITVSKSKEKEEINQIKEDLLSQLIEQNKLGKDFESMIEDYITLEETKRKLEKDIKKKGVRVEVKTGNGFTKEVKNDSIELFVKVNNQMLKIRSELGLNEPSKPPEEGKEDDLL